MTVDPAEAATTTHDGATYHFCADGCRDAFIADPDRFAAAPAHEPLRAHPKRGRSR